MFEFGPIRFGYIYPMDIQNPIRLGMIYTLLGSCLGMDITKLNPWISTVIAIHTHDVYNYQPTFLMLFFFFFLWWCLRSGAWVVLLLEKENKGYSKIYGEMTRSKIWWKISCMLILSLWIMTNSFVCYAIFMMKSLEV
jgi:hypothetical protein